MCRTRSFKAVPSTHCSAIRTVARAGVGVVVVPHQSPVPGTRGGVPLRHRRMFGLPGRTCSWTRAAPTAMPRHVFAAASWVHAGCWRRLGCARRPAEVPRWRCARLGALPGPGHGALGGGAEAGLSLAAAVQPARCARPCPPCTTRCCAAAIRTFHLESRRVVKLYARIVVCLCQRLRPCFPRRAA